MNTANRGEYDLAPGQTFAAVQRTRKLAAIRTLLASLAPEIRERVFQELQGHLRDLLQASRADVL